jgi:ABC-type spermidine/putrescine transport system permease subunit I
MVIYSRARWCITFFLFIVFLLRMVVFGGFYVVSYILAIFVLNSFLGFITPKFGDVEDEEEDNPILPMNEQDEYKPMVRKINEMKFWESVTIAFVVALVCTLFKGLDIAVYWPILVFYVIFLFIFTMRRQIAHMVKHKYIPFDLGKTSYVRPRQ